MKEFKIYRDKKTLNYLNIWLTLFLLATVFQLIDFGYNARFTYPTPTTIANTLLQTVVWLVSNCFI